MIIIISSMTRGTRTKSSTNPAAQAKKYTAR